MMTQENLIEKVIETKNLQKQELMLFKLFLTTDKKDLEEVMMELEKQRINYYSELFQSRFVLIGRDYFYQSKKDFEQKYDTKPNYTNILKQFKNLVKELEITSGLKTANLYTYLVWNGYFSKENEFVFQFDDRAVIPGLYAYDIMNGNGVCMNLSEMLSDIINTCGYNSALVSCRFKKCKTPLYVPNLKRNFNVRVEKFCITDYLLNIISNIVSKKNLNHAINVIKDGTNLYGYDATNLTLIELNSNRKGTSPTGRGDFYLDPYQSYCYNMSKKSSKVLDSLNYRSQYRLPYTINDFKEIFDDNIELFDRNRTLFEDFHLEIYPDIIKISNAVYQYKKEKIEN